MALSKIQIINLALIEINNQRLDSLTTTQRGQDCSLVYDACLDVIMEEYDWHFARKTASLSLSTTEPLIDYAYAYNMPADFMRIYKVSENLLPDDYTVPVGDSEVTVTEKTGTAYEINGNLLLCNLSPCYLVYTAKANGLEAMFKPSFIEALVKLIASKLSNLFSTGSSQLGVSKLNEYAAFLKIAKMRDGTQGQPQKETDEDDPWINGDI